MNGCLRVQQLNNRLMDKNIAQCIFKGANVSAFKALNPTSEGEHLAFCSTRVDFALGHIVF